jgi:S1-C subfamily serine protease
LALLALGVVVAAITASVVVRGADRAPAAAGPDAERRLNLAVVAIDARIGADTVRSSGIVLDPDRGLVLTSAHSIWGATSLRVATGLGLLYGRIVARAPCRDLALLELQPRIPGLETLRPARTSPPPGELVTAVGRRRAPPQSGSESLLVLPARVGTDQVRRINPLLPPLRKPLGLDAALVPEVSGGPLVDPDGHVVGMAQAAAGLRPSRGAAITWAEVRRLIGELRAGPRRIYVGWRRQYDCVAQQHAYARALHRQFRARDARLNPTVRPTRLPGVEVPGG